MSEFPPPATPPSYSNYPRAGYYGDHGGGRPPGVYFDAIGTAFEYMKADMVTWTGAALVVLAIYVPLIVAGNFFGNLLAYGNIFGGSPRTIQGFLIGVAVGIVPAMIGYGLIGGLILIGVRQIRGEPYSIGTVFAGLRNPGGLIVAGLILFVATYAGFVLCLIPGFYLSTRLVFAPFLPTLQGDAGGEAVKHSWAALKGHVLEMFALVLVLGLIVLMGFLVCGVGLLFTLPIYALVIVQHYTFFFPRQISYSAPIGAEYPT